MIDEMILETGMRWTWPDAVVLSQQYLEPTALKVRMKRRISGRQ
jgi:hypothetical protein